MTPTVTEIDAADAARRWRAAPDDVVLLDCREPQELALSRIEGAVHIPLGDIKLRMNRLDPDKQTIVFCHHGQRSYSVARYLLEQGFEHVASMKGGIEAWSQQVDPTVPLY